MSPAVYGRQPKDSLTHSLLQCLERFCFVSTVSARVTPWSLAILTSLLKRMGLMQTEITQTSTIM